MGNNSARLILWFGFWISIFEFLSAKFEFFCKASTKSMMQNSINTVWTQNRTFMLYNPELLWILLFEFLLSGIRMNFWQFLKINSNLNYKYVIVSSILKIKIILGFISSDSITDPSIVECDSTRSHAWPWQPVWPFFEKFKLNVEILKCTNLSQLVVLCALVCRKKIWTYNSKVHNRRLH